MYLMHIVKKPEYADDFIIVIDSREQNPLFKRPEKGLLVVRDKLEVGDYSVRGFEHEIVCERKSINDFLGSISNNRDRFKRMLEKMKEWKLKFIMIEGTLEELLAPQTIKSGFKSIDGKVTPLTKQYSGIHPNSIYQTIISIMVRYGIIFYFASNRKDGEKFVLSVLRKFYKLKREGELRNFYKPKGWKKEI